MCTAPSALRHHPTPGGCFRLQVPRRLVCRRTEHSESEGMGRQGVEAGWTDAILWDVSCPPLL